MPKIKTSGRGVTLQRSLDIEGSPMRDVNRARCHRVVDGPHLPLQQIAADEGLVSVWP